MAQLKDKRQIIDLLTTSRTVAVLGAHPSAVRPAHYVPEYLHQMGYRILPVNPMKLGQTLWGQPVRATLEELGESVDIVDIFRRSDQVMDHLPDILAMDPRPKAVWMQLGIANKAAADALVAEGIDVVQNRCTLADHRRFGLDPIKE